MNKDIREYHKQAQHFYQCIQNEANRKGQLSLLLADYFYSLQRIKIAVAYRKTNTDISNEDRKYIDEIRDMFEDAAKIKNEMTAKSGAI